METRGRVVSSSISVFENSRLTKECSTGLSSFIAPDLEKFSCHRDRQYPDRLIRFEPSSRITRHPADLDTFVQPAGLRVELIIDRGGTVCLPICRNAASRGYMTIFIDLSNISSTLRRHDKRDLIQARVPADKSWREVYLARNAPHSIQGREHPIILLNPMDWNVRIPIASGFDSRRVHTYEVKSFEGLIIPVSINSPVAEVSARDDSVLISTSHLYTGSITKEYFGFYAEFWDSVNQEGLQLSLVRHRDDGHLDVDIRHGNWNGEDCINLDYNFGRYLKNMAGQARRGRPPCPQPESSKAESSQCRWKLTDRDRFAIMDLEWTRRLVQVAIKTTGANGEGSRRLCQISVKMLNQGLLCSDGTTLLSSYVRKLTMTCK